MLSPSALARLALAIFAAGCGPSPVELTGVRIAERDIEAALVTSGRIEATARVAVRADVAGRVERVLEGRGSAVGPGRELVRLADSGQAAAVSEAQSRADAARAGLAQFEAGLDPVRVAALLAERARLTATRDSARTDVERLRRLARDKAVPRADLATAERLLEDLGLQIAGIDVQLKPPPREARRAELAAAVAEAGSRLREAQRLASLLSVRAPAAGVVYSLPVSVGDYLETGGLVARIGTLDPVRAAIFVDEPELGRVELGQVAQLTADSHPGRVWNCTIDELATEVTEIGTRRVGVVLCTAPNPQGRLLPNLTVGVRVVTARATAVPSLPRSALRGTGPEASVWIMEGARATRRSVDSGVAGPRFVEIRGGLPASATVLVPGGIEITEGMAVRVSTAEERW